MRKDPICGMQVDDDSDFFVEHEGEVFYFCSAGCREKFLRAREPKGEGGFDLIIIGGGPAGLTAATFAATLRIKSFMIASQLGGQAIDSSKIENYMGFDFITGPELIEKFEQQLFQSHFIEHLIAEVSAVEPANAGFVVRTFAGGSYFAKTVLVATGMTRRRLGIPGEETFQRRGIFYGNPSDYSFLQGEEAVVIGGGNSALQMVENLQSVACRISLVSQMRLSADPVVLDRITRIASLTRYLGYETVSFAGQQRLEGVVVRDKKTSEIHHLPARGAFIAIGNQPNSTLVSDLLRLNRKLEIPVKADCSTACRGLFAAGDVTDAFGKRIIIAAGEGAKAAIAVRQYLLHLERGEV